MLSKREPGCHSHHHRHEAPTRTNRWLAQRYNVNNAWIFNGNNGNLNNNNNVAYSYRSQAVTNLHSTRINAFTGRI